jgi:hypothetical protein
MRGDGVMARDVGDGAVHRWQMRRYEDALRRGSQLDDVHRLARVHVHVEAHAVGHHHA